MEFNELDDLGQLQYLRGMKDCYDTGIIAEDGWTNKCYMAGYNFVRGYSDFMPELPTNGDEIQKVNDFIQKFMNEM